MLDDEELTKEDIVAAVASDQKFLEAIGPSDRAALIADAAVTAALMYVGLHAMVVEIEHERSGHA